MMVRTVDLMQVSHPGFQLLQSHNINVEEELPIFMEYCVIVCRRFKFYANKNHEFVTMLSLTDVIGALDELSETDDPSRVFPLRREIKESVTKFKELCEDMASCITNESVAADFYIRLGHKTYNYCLEYAGVEE
jgi:hypothetical protein